MTEKTITEIFATLKAADDKIDRIHHETGWFLPRSALNELQIETLKRFLPHAYRAHEIDCKIRKDAKETWYQFDFIKHLKPVP